MTLTFITHDPCGLCGYHRKGVRVVPMRINKRSMRSTGDSLVMLPSHCQECGHVTPLLDVQTWRLTPDSAEKAKAYRLRRWPELEAALSRTTTRSTEAATNERQAVQQERRSVHVAREARRQAPS